MGKLQTWTLFDVPQNQGGMYMRCFDEYDACFRSYDMTQSCESYESYVSCVLVVLCWLDLVQLMHPCVKGGQSQKLKKKIAHMHQSAVSDSAPRSVGIWCGAKDKQGRCEIGPSHMWKLGPNCPPMAINQKDWEFHEMSFIFLIFR